jgi:acetyl esterase/lipase
MKKHAFAVLCLLASANAFAASLSWNGSVSNLWSVAANWTPNAVPQDGDSLNIGFSAGNTVNDLPGSNIYNSVIVGRAATVGGNLVRVTTEIWGAFTAPVQAMGDVIGANGVTSSFQSFDVNGHDVFIGGAKFNGAVTGTGSIHGGVPGAPGGVLVFNANSTFSGTVINDQHGVTEVNADVGSASFQNGGLFSGIGRSGPLTSTETVTPGAGQGGSGTGGFDIPGILTTGNLALVPNGLPPITSYRADLVGTAPGSYDQLKVIGSVKIQLAYLQVSACCFSTPGQTFVIIDNEGSDPIDGTFYAAPEGAAIQSLGGSKSFRISYHGGDGNDVELTLLAQPTSVTVASSPSSSVTGQPVMLTATVTGSPTPTGTVSFLNDSSTVLTTATLDASGHATTTYPFVLTTEVRARYDGDSNYGSKTSSSVHQQLNPASTSLSLSVSPNPAAAGQQVVATLQLSITPPGSAPPPTTPFGIYTVFVDNVQAANVSASGTSPVNINLPNQSSGDHTVTATYTDQTNQYQSTGYHPSSAGPVTLHVNSAFAATTTSATANGTTINITVSASGATPTGTVTVSNGATPLGSAALNGSGQATINIAPLAPGSYTLTVIYTPSGNFSGSSTTVGVTFGAPAIIASNTSASEGNSTATIQVPVNLSVPMSQAVSVSYATANGTASAGSDYQAAAGSITFAPGETSKSISITILGDTQPEADEQFTVVFSNAFGAALSTSQVTVTLMNDDPFFSVTSGVQYALAGGTPLTLELLTPTQGTGPFPLIVAIEASDWSAPSAHSGIAAREANRDYVVATIGFRSSDLFKFPAQIADVKAAVRWLRANAARYNIDPNRVGVWGIGAGGHLAALLGTAGEVSALDDAAEGNPTFSSRVQAVVDWYGQTDFLQLNAESIGCIDAIDHDSSTSAESRLIGCAIQPCNATARTANPIVYVSAGDPPFLIMHGTADCIVPAAQSQLLYNALRSAGVDATLQLIGGGHGDVPWTAAATLQIVDDFFDAKLRKVAARKRPARH